MQTDIFHLKIVPIKDILVHEQFDDSRVFPLVASLKEDKQLSNPIIVASLDNQKYLQLDGMNRLSAFKKLGLDSILVQIVDYNNQETVELSSWLHIFKGDINHFIANIESNGNEVSKAKFEQVGHRYIKEEGRARICTVISMEGFVYLVYSKGELMGKVKSLNKITEFYKDKIQRDVLPIKPNRIDIDLLFQEHEPSNIIVIFPTFTRHQIVDVAKRKELFPAGMTRHIIQRRCLNVNVPLTLFTKERSIKKQNVDLEKLLFQKKFRLYEESTVYFE